MTPLAHRIVKVLTLPKKARLMDDRGGLLSRMDDVHCFDVTEAVPLIRQLAEQLPKHGAGDVSCFLPAPKTWIEFRGPRGRHGMLLEERGPGTYTATGADDDCGQLWSMDRGSFHGSPAVHPGLLSRAQYLARMEDSEEFYLAALAVINTPRVIGRRQHMPHRGLERRLAAAMKPQGRFPLHAWTEVLLHVTPPADLSGEPSTEAHLTGARALHFCRSHLRVRLGRLEIVRAHWRGDASLGIKQSRYKVAA